MKTTLASFLNPRFDAYRSIGELARTLQHLLPASRQFRNKGRWGDSGPTEELVDHSGCTGSVRTNWQTERMWGNDADCPTWQEHHDRLYKCLLAALCDLSPASIAWRAANQASLDMPLRFPMAYQHATEEQEAWAKFSSLHLHVLPVKTLNPQHRNIKLLVFPQVEIGDRGIYVNVEVTDKTEWRQSKGCCSRWDVAWLTDASPPKWNYRRETFAAFIVRAVTYYKTIKPRK